MQNMINRTFTVISTVIFILQTCLFIERHGSWGGYIFENICVICMAFILVKACSFFQSKSDGFIFSVYTGEILLLMYETFALIDFIYLCYEKSALDEWCIIDILRSVSSNFFFVTGWYLFCLLSSLKRVYRSRKVEDIFFQLPVK